MGLLGRTAYALFPNVTERFRSGSAARVRALQAGGVPGMTSRPGTPSMPQSAKYNDFARAMEQAIWLSMSVSVLAQKAADLPLKVYRPGRGGEREDLGPDHPLLQLLCTPNPVHPGMLFDEMIYSYILLGGAAPIYVAASRGGGPGELWPLRPDQVWVYPSATQWIDHYEHRVGTTITRYAPEEIILLRTAHPQQEYFGLAPVQPLEGVVALDLMARTWNMATFQNHAGSAGVWSTDDPMMTADQAREIEAHIDEKFKGPANAGRSLVAWGGMRFTQAGTTARDMEYSALLDRVRDTQTSGLHVPPIMAGRTENASYDNATTQIKLFYANGVKRLTNTSDAGYNHALAPKPLGWPRSILSKPYQGLIVETDFSGVPELQEDQEKLERIRDLKLRNWTSTINEIRAERGEGPVSWGDEAWGSMSNVPLGTSWSLGGGGGAALAARSRGGPDIARFAGSCGPSGCHRKVRLRFLPERRIELWFKFAGGLERQQRLIGGVFARLYAKLAADVDVEGDVPFALDAWRKRFAADGLPVIRDVLQAGAQEGLNQANELTGQEAAASVGGPGGTPTPRGPSRGIAKAFDIAPTMMVEFLRQRENKLRGLADTSYDDLKASLVQGREAGESVESLRGRVEKVLGQSVVDQDLDALVGWRAERVARTETIGANNQGALFGYEMSGAVDGKEWLATQDPPRSREEHDAIDGMVVGLDEAFDVGGESLEFPGDPNGSPENIINCRCSIAPVVM